MKGSLDKLKGKKLWILCGDVFYLGSLTQVSDDLVYMTDVRVFTLDSEGSINETYLNSRDVFFRQCKISSVLSADEDEDDYTGE